MTISTAKAFSPEAAIVGAGLSGLTCARELAKAGLVVNVFDKGRRPGGRMSTRGLDRDLSFDHGCQYFSADAPGFMTEVDAWVEAGVVSIWKGHVVEWRQGDFTENPMTRPRYVGTPGMASICGHLATGLNVRSDVEVFEVRRLDNKWHLLDEAGDLIGRSDALIVATPPGQVRKLVTHSALLATATENVRMSPCWTVMMAFNERVDFPSDGAILHDSPLCWFARNSSKPMRSQSHDCWVVQASADWSAEHIEAEKHSVATRIADQFRGLVGSSLKPVLLSAHRWRYATPTQPLDSGCVFDDTLNIGLCGDWCLGNRVEAAFLSGTAAADRLLQLMANGRL